MGCSPSKPDGLQQVVQGEPVLSTPVSFGRGASTTTDTNTPPPLLEGTVDLIAPTSKRFAKYHVVVDDGELSYRLVKKNETLVLAVNELLQVVIDADNPLCFTVPMRNMAKPLSFRLPARAELELWANGLQRHICLLYTSPSPRD